MSEALIAAFSKLPLQSKSYNCGSTAVFAVMKVLGLNPELSADDVEKIMGTNPVIGTTGRIMKDGLRRCGISTFLGGSHLKASLRNDFVIMRTVISGSRHWLVGLAADGKNNITVWDPSLGVGAFDSQTISRFRRPVNQEACFISRDPEIHQAFHKPRSTSSVDELKPSRKPIHEIPLQHFLFQSVAGSRTILEESDFGLTEIAYIEKCARAVGLFAADPQFRPMEYQHPNLLFFGERGDDYFNNMLVRDRQTNEPVAVISRGTTYVVPARRGEGIGAELVLAAYSDARLNFLNPSHYSRAGFQSRVSAWKKARLSAGLDVAEAEAFTRPQFAAEAPARAVFS
jgi:hypothetical protein